MDDMIARGWEQLTGRNDGPLTFRLIVQPLVASFLAIRSGLRDAREGRPVFFWAAVLDSETRTSLLRHGWKDIGKLFIVAAILDVIYQMIVLHWVYPVQVLIVAVALAIVPYLAVRGLTNRIARQGYRRINVAEETPLKVADQLQLALERTFLAHERTLMAWVRTATSLITFGFALYKFFHYLHEQDPVRHAGKLFGARTFGLLMIVTGMLTLALAAWQHRQQMKQLRAQYANAPFSLSLVVAVLIAGLGLVAILAAAFRA